MMNYAQLIQFNDLLVSLTLIKKRLVELNLLEDDKLRVRWEMLEEDLKLICKEIGEDNKSAMIQIGYLSEKITRLTNNIN